MAFFSLILACYRMPCTIDGLHISEHRPAVYIASAAQV